MDISFNRHAIGLNSLLFRLVLLHENIACHVTRIHTPSDLACVRVSWLAESRPHTAKMAAAMPHHSRHHGMANHPSASNISSIPVHSWQNAELLDSYLLTIEHYCIPISYQQNTCPLKMFIFFVMENRQCRQIIQKNGFLDNMTKCSTFLQLCLE